MAAAADLSRRGVSCLVVDKKPFPGGHATDLPCKATTSCARCNACLLEETMTGLAPTRTVTLKTGAVLTGLRKQDELFEVDLSWEPVYLDQDKCLDCGLCYQVCPARDRAIRRAPTASWGPQYALFGEDCLFLKGEDCRACHGLCPVDALDFSARAGRETVTVQAVVMAGGYTPFDPRLKPRYGYGKVPNVISALELDQSLRFGGHINRPSDGKIPSRVAFVQCVGSRDKSLGRDYCSRICCGYALRMAWLIRHRWPETAISFFYMDVQTTGRDFEAYYQETGRHIELIHGVPGEITAGPDGLVQVPFVGDRTGLKETRDFDLVVLSVGLGPPDQAVVQLLGLENDEDGFPVGRPDEGLFLAGAASGPMSVAESITFARGAAEKVSAYLKNRT